ncbi:MAG: transferrin-binding protein-like solute binding protein [Sphingomonas sp.]
MGSFHSLKEDATGATLYQGNASTVRAPSGQVTYDPRDGIFEVTFNDDKAGIDRNIRFQDPAHRTNFPGAERPDIEVPNFAGFNYLEALDTDENAVFFYERPGNNTAYVSLAGFVRTHVDTAANNFLAEHGVFVFGQVTPRAQVPISGSGTYQGGFLATLVENPTLDSGAPASSILQWMSGTSRVDVNFATAALTVQLDGVVGATYIKDVQVSDLALTVPSNARFSATGAATIDYVRSGGFTGSFSSAGFTWPGKTQPVSFQSVNPGNDTAGASSIDGTFFGPNAINLGGNFGSSAASPTSASTSSAPSPARSSKPRPAGTEPCAPP